MQLDISPVTTRLPDGRAIQTFDVRCDGVTVRNVGTRRCAKEYMDQLWEKRPEADRELERQYLHSIGEL